MPLLLLMFFINTQQAIAQDTDGDGVPNITDIDDDNDGILDFIENRFQITNWNKDPNSTVTPNKATLIGNSFVVTNTAMGWNESWHSDNLTATYGSDFEISFKIISPVPTSTKHFFVGLDDVIGAGSTINYLGTDYALFLSSTNIYIYENGLIQMNALPYTINDRFSIKKSGTIITYKKNGVVVHTSTNPANAAEYYLDTAFHSGDFTLSEISITLDNIFLDTDGDGVRDSLDLDSDNDGCPDAIEAAIPTALKDSGTNASDGIADNTPNASINIASDPVGTNGYANSLENADTSLALTLYAFTETNHAMYAVDNSKNGCGTALITQVYRDDATTTKYIEVTNIDPSKVVVPYGANINFFNGGVTTSRSANFGNPTEIASGSSFLFKNTGTLANVTGTPIENTSITSFDNINDIVTISRSGAPSSTLAWDTRIDVIQNIKDKTSYVRIDETTAPNTTYTSSEWVAFVDDALDPYRVLASGGPQRHPHDPLLSEVQNPNPQANNGLGLHRINLTSRTGSAWSNGYPDRSRYVIIDEDYNHSGSRLSARKMVTNTSKKLTITDNLLVITNSNVINGEIRLIGTSQLVQTHTNTSLVSGTGKLLVDQNSTVPSVYRYNYMSSPVNTIGANTYTVESIFKDGTTPLNISGIIGTTIAKNINFLSGVYDGAATDPISLAEYWIYTYAPSANGRSAWSQKLKSGIIPQTDGFIFKGPGRPQNYTFLGTPKDGNLTGTVGRSESYLVGNPFPSALSVQKFIEDNINSTTATLYFWEHVGENNTSTNSSGHNFGGYIGGYATRNIAMGLSANDPSIDTKVNLTLQAEAATLEGAINFGGTGFIVELKSITNNYIKFSNIIKGADTLKIHYQSAVDKSIILKVDNHQQTYTLPATATYTTVEIPKCIPTGSELTISSNDTNLAYIDYILLQDGDGNRCSPSTDSGGNYNAPKEYVPIGQGFFIVGDDTDGGPIVFNNSQREFKTEGAESIFFKSTIPQNKKYPLPILKLGMDFINNQGTSTHRQLGISFHKSNSFAFDKGYDSEIYDLGPTDIYWKFPNDDLKYVIAGVQEISDDLEVPFDIVMNYNGSITIQIDEIKAIDRNLFIKDKLTNQTYLLNNNTVALQLTKGSYTDRFALAFKPSKTLSVDDQKLLDKYIKIYTDNNQEIIINKNTEMNINNISLYNILGVKVRSWNIKEHKNNYKLNVKKLIPTGIYIIKLNTNKGLINKKLIIIK